MIARVVGSMALVFALGAVLGWPALATVLDATRGADNPGGGAAIRVPIEGGADLRPWRMAGETLRLVATTEALALPLGVIVAFVLFRTDLPGRRVWLAILALAALVPMPLHAAGWLGGFGNLGRSQAIGSGPILAGRFGAAFVHAAAALPWVVWIVGVGLLGVEAELEESARLDLPGWRVAISISLRRSLGAIAGAALAVAVLTAGDMTVTDLALVRTYAEEAYIQYGLGRGPGTAAATALPPLVVLGGAIAIGASWLLRVEPERVVSPSASGPLFRLGAWRGPLGLAVGLGLGTLVGLPVYALVWRAGRVNGNARLGIAPSWSIAGLIGTLRGAASDLLGPNPAKPLRGPLAGTLLWGSLGATGATALGWSVAWACRAPGPWRLAAATAAAVCLATPGPVVGMAMVLAYHRVDAIYGTPAIVVLTYVARTWTYALIATWPAVRGLPREYLEVAELAGLGPSARLIRVGLPTTLGAIGLAWALAFVLAIGELPAAGLVMPPGQVSITTRIWDLLHIGVDSRLAGIALLTLGVFAGIGLLAGPGIARVVREREAS